MPEVLQLRHVYILYTFHRKLTFSFLTHKGNRDRINLQEGFSHYANKKLISALEKKK